MRKITAYYYLEYPDRDPPDPFDADSEVRIEIGGPESTIDHFEDTYSIRVLTVRRLKNLLDQSEGKAIALGTAMVVERFDDETIRDCLEEILPNIEEYAVLHG